MLDRIVFDRLPNDEIRNLCKVSLATLVQFGVFQAQLDIEKENLIQGNSDQPESELAAAILQFRRVSQNLMTLQLLGEQYKKEMEL